MHRTVKQILRKEITSHTTMTTLPTPPFVTVPGIANFRDAGGHATASGKNVRTGLIFRSADPSKATEEGLNKLSKEIGKVCLVCDHVVCPQR